MRIFTRIIATTLLFPLPLRLSPAAENHNPRIDRALTAANNLPGVIRSDIGVTRKGTKIPCLISSDDLDFNTQKTRILIVGLETIPQPVQTTLSVLKWFYTSKDADKYRKNFALSAVPLANPDGWAMRLADENGSGGKPAAGFPPKGTAYNSTTNPESAYLWRWIGMHAPDLVIVLGSGSTLNVFVPENGPTQLQPLRKRFTKFTATQSHDLVSNLVTGKPSNIGSIPAVRIDANERSLPNLLQQIMESGFKGPSPARREIQQRLTRSPIEVATQLSKRYGHDLNSVAYIPALALIGRLRLGGLSHDGSHRSEVEKIVRPYFTGNKPSLGKRVSGSNLSGHLIFGELARLTDHQRYVDLARAAADLGFDANGRPKAAMPYHSEMSDAVFMGTPILVQVGRLTGETKYYDMALRHMRFMLKLNLRKDGLHRHSPLDEAAWGRGNGFPALGLSLSLSDLPKEHPGRDEMLRAFRSHIAALVPHQDPTGTWHQVIDHPESYREFTSTCMITFAMLRGVRNGWLEEETYRPIINKAWYAIRTRIAPDGTLVDVCTGTGKQKNLRAYFDRTAILGADARGGAMALMVSTEMAINRKK